MKKSEYDALVEKIGADLKHVYEKNKALVKYKTMIEAESASSSWAIGQVLSESYATNCKYYYTATLDAIEQFSYAQFSIAHHGLEFEPETLTGHRPQMLILDEVSDWDEAIHSAVQAQIDYLASKGLPTIIPTKFYGKGLSDLIEEIESANEAKALNHAYEKALHASTGPWPQAGVYPYVIGPANDPETASKAEEKPGEGDSGLNKPQSAAEDFSAIAKRMKELAAEKGNS